MRLGLRYPLIILGLIAVAVVGNSTLNLIRHNEVDAAVRATSARVLDEALTGEIEHEATLRAERWAKLLAEPLYRLDLVRIGELARTLRGNTADFEVRVFDATGALLHDGTRNFDLFGADLTTMAEIGPVLREHKTAIWRDGETLYVAAPSAIGAEMTGGLLIGTKHDAAFAHRKELAAQLDGLRGRERFTILFDTIAVALGLAALGIGLGRIIARGLVGPITQLSAVAHRVGRGDYHTEIDTSRTDELGDLARALKAMADSLAASRTRLVEANSDLSKSNLELRAAKEAAEAANEAKTQFLANMSHELRTPLNAIIGFSDMIGQEMLGPIGNTRYAEYVRDINLSGQHLLEVVNDVLDMARVESGHFELKIEPIDLAAALKPAARFVEERAREAGLQLRLDFEADIPPLPCDERRLRQVVVNLLANAVKFTPKGGRVTLAAGTNAQGKVWIRVSDTGIGIPEQSIGRAMAVFGQVDGSLARKHEGAGLGLPLAKSLTELLGGDFDLQSKVGTGTTVTLTFPTPRALAQRSARAS
jgi:signal transduction histidine kinase